MSLRTKALLAVITTAFLWGTAGVVAKTLLQVADPFVITFYRFGIASLLILPFFLKEKKPKNYWRELIPLSLLNSVNVFFFYIGLTTTTANTAYVIGASAPLTTAFLSRLFIREHTSITTFMGISIGLTGTLLIILLPTLQTGQAFAGDIQGNIILTLGMLSWVLYAIGTRRVVSSGKYSPVTTTSINLFVTSSTALVLSLLTQKTLLIPALFTAQYLAILLFASLMITVITFFLYQWAIKYLPATTASLKEYLQLVVGIGFNTILLGETLTIGFAAGSALVVIGVFIATGQRVSQKIKGYFANSS